MDARCPERLYRDACQEREEAVLRLNVAEEDVQKLKTDFSQLSDELNSLKTLSPEAAQILSDFKPFEDIPSTVTAPLPVCVFRYIYYSCNIRL